MTLRGLLIARSLDDKEKEGAKDTHSIYPPGL
jgi:hypothetical protein